MNYTPSAPYLSGNCVEDAWPPGGFSVARCGWGATDAITLLAQRPGKDPQPEAPRAAEKAPRTGDIGTGAKGMLLRLGHGVNWVHANSYFEALAPIPENVT